MGLFVLASGLCEVDEPQPSMGLRQTLNSAAYAEVQYVFMKENWEVPQGHGSALGKVKRSVSGNAWIALGRLRKVQGKCCQQGGENETRHFSQNGHGAPQCDLPAFSSPFLRFLRASKGPDNIFMWVCLIQLSNNFLLLICI